MLYINQNSFFGFAIFNVSRNRIAFCRYWRSYIDLEDKKNYMVDIDRLVEDVVDLS
jgi:hypothetical protein